MASVELPEVEVKLKRTNALSPRELVLSQSEFDFLNFGNNRLANKDITLTALKRSKRVVLVVNAEEGLSTRGIYQCVVVK
jgi:hypothetical protein